MSEENTNNTLSSGNSAHEYLSTLMDIVVREGASDLHLSAGLHPMIRVAGSLMELQKQNVLSETDTRAMLKTLLSQEQFQQFLETQEIDFSYTHKDTARFRCNAFFTRGSIGIALRLIPQRIRSLEELNLPPALAEFAHREQGFFLVVGPVGSGKTTTLASLIEIINAERAQHIVTIEDPIEYTFEEKNSIIDQREVGVDTLAFNTALSSAFRQDVDVLMIGEMRELETISAAVTAAETGHLVLSTLHTNDAAQTIDRIIDSFPAAQQDQIRLQLSASLAGIFSQRLVPRISGGRIPAYELLINTPAVANLIREQRTHEIRTLIETGSGEGMIEMNRSLANLVRKGEITTENAVAYSTNPKALERLL